MAAFNRLARQSPLGLTVYAPSPAAGLDVWVLAVGGQLKNTFCLAAGDSAYLGPHVGDALERARDGSNDRWSEASGDALRDLADKLLIQYGNDGRMALEHLADPGRGILAVLNPRHPPAIEQLHAAVHHGAERVTLGL